MFHQLQLSQFILILLIFLAITAIPWRVESFKQNKQNNPKIFYKRGILSVTQEKLTIDSVLPSETLKFQILQYANYNENINRQNIKELFQRDITLQPRDIIVAVTKSIPSLTRYHKLEVINILMDYLENHGEYKNYIDARLYSSYMLALVKSHRFEEALKVMSEMKMLGKPLDAAIYVNAIKAACYCRNWNDSLILLKESYLHFPNNFEQSLITILTNIKFTADRLSSPIEQLWEILEWTLENRIEISQKVLDASLSTISALGSIEDVNQFMTWCKINKTGDKFKPTLVTMNTLLNRYALERDLESCNSIIQLMRKNNIPPDIVSYNTLLKLHIELHQVDKAYDVLDSIKELHPTAYTKVLMLQLYAISRRYERGVSLMNEVVPQDLSAHLFSTYILQYCHSNFSEGIYQFKRAISNGCADDVVFTSTAQLCLHHREFHVAIKIFDFMLYKYRIPWNKFSLSVMLNVCLTTHKPYLVSKLCMYLEELADSSQRNLISNAICQKVMKELVRHGELLPAMSLQLGPLSNVTCKSEVLDELLGRFQDLILLELDKKEEIARKSLAILRLYSQQSHKHVLNILHFNHVLRLLAISKMFSISRELFYLISNEDMLHFNWTPNTFTIAELIRSSRESKIPEFAFDVIIWASKFSQVFIPFAVISDAISFVYGEGKVDLVIPMYEALYNSGKVQHWQDRMANVVDLHSFSRGMAFAAVSSIMREIQEKLKKEAKSSELIIIITGQAMSRSNTSGQYLLLHELQNILIEDMYPPISSSTIPGNPGRLLIQCNRL